MRSQCGSRFCEQDNSFVCKSEFLIWLWNGTGNSEVEVEKKGFDNPNRNTNDLQPWLFKRFLHIIP